MNVTLGTHNEPRRAAALRELAEATGSIGRNEVASVSELMSRLADVAEALPAATAARLNEIFSLPGRAVGDLVSPLEQVVIDLLRGYETNYITNPALRAWVTALVDDPGECRHLVTYTEETADADVAQRMAEFGFQLDATRNRPAYRALFPTPIYAASAEWDDRANYWLAVALLHYRQQGRPDIALSRADKFNVMSLPEAIQRYHETMSSDSRPRLATERYSEL